MDHKAAVLQAIHTVWPPHSPNPEVRIKLAAATFLATLPAPYSTDYNTIYLELYRVFGNVKTAFGHKVKPTDILIADDHFIADRPGHNPGSNLFISLNVPYLLHHVPTIPKEQLPPLTTMQQLLWLIQQNSAWSDSDPERRVMKQLLAAHIIRAANVPCLTTRKAVDGVCCSPVRYNIQPAAAVKVMYAAMGKPSCTNQEAKLACPHILQNEPYFILKAASPNKITKGHLMVELNIAAMFRDIQTAAAAAPIAAPAAAAENGVGAASAAAATSTAAAAADWCQALVR